MNADTLQAVDTAMMFLGAICCFILGRISWKDGEKRTATLSFFLGMIFFVLGTSRIIQYEPTNAKATEPTYREFTVATRQLGGGNVIQTPTNATSFMGVGVVSVNSSLADKFLLGDRTMLMGTDLKTGEYVDVNLVTVSYAGSQRELYRFKVAERPSTNKVVSATAP